MVIIEAEIIVSHKTSVNSTAEFKGNLLTDKLEVELGAILEGNFTTHTQNKVPKSLIKIDSDTNYQFQTKLKIPSLKFKAKKLKPKKRIS